MMKALLALLLLSPLAAQAQTCPAGPQPPIARDAVRLNWDPVTLWVEGAAIPTPTQITYSVYEVVGTTNVLRCTTTATSAGQLGLAVGNHIWRVTAKTPLSMPVPNVESAMSSPASKTIPPAPLTVPAPGNLSVTGTDLIAYGIQQTPDKLTTFPVGSAMVGTPCNTASTVNGLFQIPRDAVTYAGSVKPAVVFAACSGG